MNNIRYQVTSMLHLLRRAAVINTTESPSLIRDTSLAETKRELQLNPNKATVLIIRKIKVSVGFLADDGEAPKV